MAKKERKKWPIWIKATTITLLCVIGAMILTVGGYVLYVVFQYSRIPDNLQLSIKNNSESTLSSGEYTLTTYNIGFGAYVPEYSFFMDTGVMNDGTETSGKYGKGISRERVREATDGSIAAIKSLGSDFVFVQEADEKADRSYFINQREEVENISGYASSYGENFHSAYLFYPLNDPHGKTNAGLVTLSKYKVDSAVRRSFPLSTGFDKFFDLDRCFVVSRVPVDNGKTLVLINLHMSAYDEGGVIRAQQLEMLNEILREEYDAGNYVIAGGDFNHVLSDVTFDSKQRRPDWVATLESDDLTNNFRIVAGTDAPTCRGADIPYEKGVNYTTIIDGFVLSDNITATAKTEDLDFAYSDHNPVTLTFTLN